MPTEEFTPGSRPLVEEMPSSGGAPASESGNTFVAAAPYGESAGTRQASVTKSADPAGANAPQDPEPVPGVSGAVPDEAGSLPPHGIEALGPTTPSGVGSPGPAPEAPTPMSPGDVGTSGSTPWSGSGFPVPTSQSGAGASVAFSPSGFFGDSSATSTTVSWPSYSDGVELPPQADPAVIQAVDAEPLSEPDPTADPDNQERA